MDVDYTHSQIELRDQLKSYFSLLMTNDVVEKIKKQEGGELYKTLIRKMGHDGWLAIGWPKKYGGQGFSSAEQLIFFEQALLAHAPIPFVTLNTVGPALIDYGSDELKKQFLPLIASGEIHFAIGYTEPDAGTDLAMLSTRAEKNKDEYIINGTKVFTSGAEDADYIWLAARTKSDVRHKGISLFIVDTKLPGFSLSPIHTVGGFRTNITYYNDVRVHQSMMVGELNNGWNLILSQLNHERIGLAAWGIVGWGLYKRVLLWAREKNKIGCRVIDESWVQYNLAKVYAHLEAMRIMNARMAWSIDEKKMDPALISGVKVYSTETIIEVCRLLMEVVGPHSLVCSGSDIAVLQGDLEREYRRCQINTFGGGVNEILRGIVANFGLNMEKHR